MGKKRRPAQPEDKQVRESAGKRSGDKEQAPPEEEPTVSEETGATRPETEESSSEPVSRQGSAASDGEETAYEPERMPEEEPSRELFDSIIDTVAKEGLSPKPDEDPDESLSVHLERAVRVPLEVYVRVVNGERVARALTRDISTSGIFLAALTLSIAKPGEVVMVELTLPGSQDPVWARAKVARVGENEAFPALGLAFEALPDSDREIIEEYIAGRARFVDV